MRGATLLLLVCGGWRSDAWSADLSFPYQAVIAVDNAEARSGPGQDYYGTLKLPRGTSVEVYRHDPGGWLAIRPPEGSCSWITARHVKATADKGVAEVVFDGAVAWVGSSLSEPAQYKWQVRLEQGERVATLSEKSLSVGPGFATETYVQVAPPAGEFRWVQADQLRADAGGSAAETSSSPRTPPAARSVGGPAASPPDQPATGPVNSPVHADEHAAKVEDLQVELSLLVTQPIDQWDLASLQKRVETLLGQEVSPGMRREAEAVAQRIAEFQTLQRRHQKSQLPVKDDDQEINKHGITVAPKLLPQDSAPDAVGSAATGVAPASGEASDSPFAAVGWLMPVHSTKRVAPPFALLDDDGRVTAYVTPTLGLNLRRYTKKYVGIVGETRYVASLQATHVSAQRVVKQEREGGNE